MSAEDAEKEQNEWYDPKMTALYGFAEEATQWIKPVVTEEDGTETDECNDDVRPQESVSNVKSVLSRRSIKSSQSSRSSIVSAKLKLEGQRVELMARSARLIRKQELEKEEALLRAKKEQLELEIGDCS